MSSLSHIPEPDHSESAESETTDLKVVGKDGSRRKADAGYYTYDEAAPYVWESLQTRKRPAKRYNDRLDTLCRELIAAAIDGDGKEDEIWACLEDIRTRHPDVYPAIKTALDRTKPPADRPIVEITTERHKVVDQTIIALGADPDLYYRGKRLVEVVREERSLIHLTTQTTMSGVSGSAKIIDLDDQVIGTRLTRFAEFIQWRKDKKGELYSVPCHPPDWLYKSIARQQHWRGIRPLVAIAECPYPRFDGSIVETPGYDPATMTVYLPSIEFPRVPEHPTRDDARAAAGRILEYVKFFPFKSDDDRAVFLAGMLGVIARQGIVGSMPGIAVNGNKAGTGKGKLVDGMVIPGTGRLAPVSKYPYDDAEAGKVKTSVVLAGKTLMSFDNLNEGTAYGGGDVDSLITGKITDDRIMGGSTMTGELIVRLVCFVNGNNIEPTKDATRRWLVCNLVTDQEHPERREDLVDADGNDLPDFGAIMLENRGSIVRDCLTILRAHSLAGYPRRNPDSSPLGGPLASFDAWDRIIRGAIHFATGLDCTKTQLEAAEHSSDFLEKVGLIEGLYELPGAKLGERGITAAEIYKLVDENPSAYQQLRDALRSRGRAGKLAEPRIIGNHLKALLNNPLGGFRLTKHNKEKQRYACWLVERLRDNLSFEDDEESESCESCESVLYPPMVVF